MELFIQLAIIMIGKQIFNTIIEIGFPYAMKKYRKFMYGTVNRNQENEIMQYNQWTKDYKLNAWNSMGLFHEYLEMILQYGFCTLFVVAFPLAPFFALVSRLSLIFSIN